MKNKVVAILRYLAMVEALLWLVVSLIDWWFCGSYAVYGVGSRLAGFFFWGILLALGLVMLAAPPAGLPDVRLRYSAPMRLRRMLPLVGWMVALGCFAVDIPLSSPHGDIISWVGVLVFVYFCGGVWVLALLGSALEKLGRWWLR